jgi:hypothetical protein
MPVLCRPAAVGHRQLGMERLGGSDGPPKLSKREQAKAKKRQADAATAARKRAKQECAQAKAESRRLGAHVAGADCLSDCLTDAVQYRTRCTARAAASRRLWAR